MATITIPTRRVDFTQLPYEVTAKVGPDEMTIKSLTPRSITNMKADIEALPDYTPPREQAISDINRELTALRNLVESVETSPDVRLIARVVKSILQKEGLA